MSDNQSTTFKKFLSEGDERASLSHVYLMYLKDAHHTYQEKLRDELHEVWAKVVSETVADLDPEVHPAIILDREDTVIRRGGVRMDVLLDLQLPTTIPSKELSSIKHQIFNKTRKLFSQIVDKLNMKLSQQKTTVKPFKVVQLNDTVGQLSPQYRNGDICYNVFIVDTEKTGNFTRIYLRNCVSRNF